VVNQTGFNHPSHRIIQIWNLDLGWDEDVFKFEKTLFLEGLLPVNPSNAMSNRVFGLAAL